jgi:hypothetical protein
VVDASFAVVEVPEKITRQADALFGETSISGRVIDGQGMKRGQIYFRGLAKLPKTTSGTGG